MKPKPNGPGIKALYIAPSLSFVFSRSFSKRGKKFRKLLGFGLWPQKFFFFFFLFFFEKLKNKTRCCCSSKMSTPMEITLQNPPDPDISDQNAVASTSASAPSPPPPPLPPVLADDRVSVSGTYMLSSSPSIFALIPSSVLEFFQILISLSVEACLKPSSTARIDDVRSAIERYKIKVFFVCNLMF